MIIEIKNKNININTSHKIESALLLPDGVLFGKKALDSLIENRNHEIANHTFSHYLCLEEGQREEDFEEDLELFKFYNTFNKPKTFIFPSNQVNEDYFDLLCNYGIKVVRVNPENNMLISTQAKKPKSIRLLIRLLRLIDRYFPLTKPAVSETKISKGIVCNSQSRFFAPYNGNLKFPEKLLIERIKTEMTYCASNRFDYHLWTHPHNFGNWSKVSWQLEQILQHFVYLRDNFGFTSARMDELI